ncbi:hypothetical protein [Paraburkholderia youngii]|uniref:hypothetical protein n=1 Tax=Paraburkholderia youngii TaxID=2782701 RepID=UPI003D2214B9
MSRAGALTIKRAEIAEQANRMSAQKTKPRLCAALSPLQKAEMASSEQVLSVANTPFAKKRQKATFQTQPARMPVRLGTAGFVESVTLLDE